VLSDTTIEAVAPAHAPGAVSVTVGAPGCTGAGSIEFECLAPPDASEGTPASTTLPPAPPADPAPATLPATGSGEAGRTAVFGGLALVLGVALILVGRRRTAASAGG
jgi:LPXTG-motif cell wall-anchored protein